MEEQKNNNFVVIGAVVLVVLALAYGLFRYVKKQDTVPEGTTQNQAVNTPKYFYKDGVYSSVGSYFSPGGEEGLGVTLTLKDDVVTDVSVNQLATRPISVKMQQAFADNYKPIVVGRKIDDLVLDKIAGSSLTPKGFNDAVVKIKAQALI